MANSCVHGLRTRIGLAKKAMSLQVNREHKQE
jgi:hypothetical protein